MIGPAHCHAGLAVAGPIINRHSGLRKRLKSIPLRHGIPHIDLVRTYLGLLCQGKNDFEAVEEVRKDLFFQQALEIGLFIETLAQTRRRGHPADLQCLLEKEILAHLFHRLEIVLALAQQAQVGAHQVDVGDAVAQGDGLEPLPQATMAVMIGPATARPAWQWRDRSSTAIVA